MKNVCTDGEGVVSMRTGEGEVIDHADIRKKYYIGKLKNSYFINTSFFVGLII